MVLIFDILGGFMLFGRFLLAYRWPQTLNGQSTEWLRGSKLCTYRGMKREFLLVFCIDMFNLIFFYRKLSSCLVSTNG